ncbi:MAG: ribokinase [Dictyoglomus sp. NZ13-RE01]|nr:MAG: ribokinase [Dictyoglomus sp. NZ13-RE01]
MRTKVVIIGSFNIDMVSKAPHLPRPGETVLGGPFVMVPGGKGSNQAICASRLGAEVYFVGCVGNDTFGEIAKNNFKRERINVDYLEVSSETHTGVALIVVDEKSGENMIVVAPGANMKVTKKTIDNAIEIIKDADVILTQFEIPIETVEYVVKVVKNIKKPKLILNPAPAREVNPHIWEDIDLITPNRSELEAISGITIESRDDIERAVEKVISLGVKNVVVTLGKEGALVVNKEKSIYVPSFKVDAVDTTGAGDAFNGGLAVALAEGKDLEEAVYFANAVAGLKVKRLGASSMPYREEVENFLKETGEALF